jgi:hypothetical protein
MRDEMETPCYVISSNGFRDSVSYEDGWCYGPSEYIGCDDDTRAARDVIKADIRANWNERNSIPVYFVSDHGNVSRVRRITLRKAGAR